MKLYALDHADNDTVIQYAVQEMIKRGVSIAVAARRTADRLNNSPNMFIDSTGATIVIDPKKLEDNLWNYVVDYTIKSIEKLKPGKEDMALQWAQDTFKQKSVKFITNLKVLVETKLGKTLEQVGKDRHTPGENTNDAINLSGRAVMKLYASKFLAQKRNRIPVKDPIAGGPGRIGKLADIEANALEFAENLLMDLELPSSPIVSLGALKGFENVQNDPLKTNGVITVYASFHSLSGHKIRMDLFIPIVRGNFYRPSIAMINGNRCVFSQALINKLLDKVEGNKPKMHQQYSMGNNITHEENIEKPMFSAPNVDGRWWSEVWNRWNFG